MISRRFVVPGLVSLSLACWQAWSAAPQSVEPIRLPIRIIQSNPATAITVGTRTVDAIVDTGGGGIDLSADIIREAGGTRLKKVRKGTDAYGLKVPDAPLFRIPVITIGGRTFRDAVVSQADPDAEGPSVPNSVGRRFLHKYLVVIDYAGSSMSLWPRDAKAVDAGCGSTRIPMERTKDSDLVVTRFTTPSGALRLVWDTGATWSILAESFAADRKLETFARGQTSFHDSKVFSAAGSDFGPMEFVVLPVQPPEKAQGFLGANFFSNHVVCLDYRKREVRVR